MIQLKPKLHFIRLLNPRRFWGFRPSGPQQGFAWTHWGCHSCLQTSCWKRFPQKNSGYVTVSSSSFSFHSFFPFSFVHSEILFCCLSPLVLPLLCHLHHPTTYIPFQDQFHCYHYQYALIFYKTSQFLNMQL